MMLVKHRDESISDSLGRIGMSKTQWNLEVTLNTISLSSFALFLQRTCLSSARRGALSLSSIAQQGDRYSEMHAAVYCSLRSSLPAALPIKQVGYSQNASKGYQSEIGKQSTEYLVLQTRLWKHLVRALLFDKLPKNSSRYLQHQQYSTSVIATQTKQSKVRDINPMGRYRIMGQTLRFPALGVLTLERTDTNAKIQDNGRGNRSKRGF